MESLLVDLLTLVIHLRQLDLHYTNT
jgi:hypothetical protein